MEVVSSQAEIEKEVCQIAQKNGFELYEEGAHVLGQWVHGESSDPSTLSGILHDLREKGDQSEWFSNAIDAWSRQFMNPNSPLEGFVFPPSIPDLYFSFTNPSLFMLLTLSFSLLLVYLLLKKRSKNRNRK